MLEQYDQSNPGIRFLRNSRLTPAEMVELWRAIRDDPRTAQHLGMEKLEKKSATYIHHSVVTPQAKELLVMGNEIRGLKSGYKYFDEMTTGLLPGELLVLFATTGIGKSLFAQNITYNVVRRGEGVLFIGLELTNAQNDKRFLQMHGPDNEGFNTLPIFYPPKNTLKADEVDPIVKAVMGEQDIKLVVIDHLHMFPTAGGNKAEGIENIMLEMKQVAVRNNVPLILVSHVNRGTEGVPTLTDLKGSSAIEQLADIAIALWRDPNAENMSLAPLKAKVWKQRKEWRRDKAEFHPLPENPARLAEVIEVTNSFFPTK